MITGVFGEEGTGTEYDLFVSPRGLGPTLVEMSLEMDEKPRRFAAVDI